MLPLAFGVLLLVSARHAVAAALLVSTGLLAYTIDWLEMWVYGIELATFTTVMAGAVFGPSWGAAAGILAIIFHVIFGEYMSVYVFWLVPSYAAAGFMAGSLNMPITQLGMTILIGLHTVFLSFLLMFDSEELPAYLLYGTLNVAVNVGLFYSVAPALLRLMG